MLYNGEFFPAARKKYEETIFFVHFYGGSKKALRRHIQWVNSIGYDAFAFNFERRRWLFDTPFTSDFRIGWKHYYADQVEALLNEVPGQKIVYAFSNPSAAAIEAMVRRQVIDVKALICDSGPSSRFIFSVANLIHRDQKFSWPRSYTLAAILSYLWSPELHQDLKVDLQALPDDFPVLSIRGGKDPLIPPYDIDEAFKLHRQLDLAVLSLPKAGHLNGLRDFPKDYKPTVQKFLQAHSTRKSK